MAPLLKGEKLLSGLIAARERGGRLLLVGGEAGVGKTTLVRAFTATAGRVVAGVCERLATPAPLGALADIAAETGGALAAEVEAGGDPRRVARALLDELAEPAVVVLEDVHWADEATLDVLRILARRVAATPSLVVATYRDDEAVGDHPLCRVLGELASVEEVERVSVPPLSLAAVRELAGHGDAEAIHALTGGNAFFVTELLAECVNAGVLEGRGSAVAFRHELARLALESTVPPRRRRDLHAAILRALDARPGADPSRLAHHADAAGDPDAVVRHGRAAAERGARAGAHREAAAQYARVLRHIDAADPLLRADLLAAHAVEAQAAGEYGDAVAALREAVELRRAAGDRPGEAVHLARMTMPCIVLGRNADADAAIGVAIAILDRLPASAETAIARGFQAYVQMIRRDNEDAVRSAQRAVALARRFDDADTLALALNMLGTAHMMAGASSGASGCCARALRSPRRKGSSTASPTPTGCSGRAWRRFTSCSAARRRCALRARAREIRQRVAPGRPRRGVGAGPPRRPPPAGRTRPRGPRGSRLAGRRPGHDGRRGPSRLPARAGQAPPVVRGRARLLAGQGRRPRHRSRVAGRALRAADRGPRPGAAERWHERGAPYEAARALAESADAADVAGALAAFEGLGAVPGARLARGRSRALGAPVPRGPRAASRANPAGLTAREIEVLRLVAGGLRNADVADRLVLSRRTVDHHVSAILRKLDARTRGEAAAAAARMGLLDGD